MLKIKWNDQKAHLVSGRIILWFCGSDEVRKEGIQNDVYKHQKRKNWKRIEFIPIILSSQIKYRENSLSKCIFSQFFMLFFKIHEAAS